MSAAIPPSMLRARWRVFRFTASLVWETSKLAFLVRFRRPEERRLYRARRQQRACAKFCRILGLKIHTRGRMPEGGAMLVVANHLGLADVWVVASVMPVAFAAKAEMGGWPVMGWICRTVGVVFVERERRMATSKFVDDIRRAMRAGVRVLVFPEGTTGNGRSVRSFKTGGFAAVAEMNDGFVLPVYHNAVKMNGRPTTLEDREKLGWFGDAPMLDSALVWMGQKSIEVEVRIGEPIPTLGADRKELARLSQEAVEALAGDLVE